MPDDDIAAREARAKRLREQIEDLKAPPESAPEAEGSRQARNPREFIQERMRELREKYRRDNSG
jgi:hypothetical protein